MVLLAMRFSALIAVSPMRRIVLRLGRRLISCSRMRVVQLLIVSRVMVLVVLGHLMAVVK